MGQNMAEAIRLDGMVAIVSGGWRARMKRAAVATMPQMRRPAMAPDASAPNRMCALPPEWHENTCPLFA